MYNLTAQPPRLGALASAIIDGSAPPQWEIPHVAGLAGWKNRVQEVRGTSPPGWYEQLVPAFGFGNSASNARDRLQAVARGNGVVVTTGQQPGLFGGPLYTWYKAITALALADEIERALGVPAAPVFWAATDDSDVAEANWTSVAIRGGARLLRARHEGPEGAPLSKVRVGNVHAELEQLRDAAVINSSSPFVRSVEEAYNADSTVGTAYVRLLRTVLEPLGISVLDSSHSAVRAAGAGVLRAALQRAGEIASALHTRDEQIRAAGMEPQVKEVPGLSLVFEEKDGVRSRVALSSAAGVAASTEPSMLSGNVLLRPVVERSIMPTVSYCGGPAEIAYFAQTAAVSRALETPPLLVVPRLSCLVVEEHIRRILSKYSVSVSDLADPHDVFGRLARQTLPATLVSSLEKLRSDTESAIDSIANSSLNGNGAVLDSPAIVEGARAGLRHRIDRLERRLLAAAKRRDERSAEDIATARGALYPLDKQQERALNIIPFLARYGDEFLDDVRSVAAVHARKLIGADEHEFAGAGRESDQSHTRA